MTLLVWPSLAGGAAQSGSVEAASLLAGSLGTEAGLDWDGWALLQVPSTAPPGTPPVMSLMRGAQKCKPQRCSCPPAGASHLRPEKGGRARGEVWTQDQRHTHLPHLSFSVAGFFFNVENLEVLNCLKITMLHY